MPWPNLDPHFSGRSNAQASEVGKSPVSCYDGNVLVTLQLAWTEHSQRNHAWQGNCNPIMIHWKELLAIASLYGEQWETALSQPCTTSLLFFPTKGLQCFNSKGQDTKDHTKPRYLVFVAAWALNCLHPAWCTLAERWESWNPKAVNKIKGVSVCGCRTGICPVIA